MGLAARGRGALIAAGHRSWRRPAAFAGLFGAILLVGIGNLDGAHQTIERLQSVNDWGFLDGVPVAGGGVGIAGGLWQWLFHNATLPPFDWWRSSRVHFGQFDITEFPFWSLLFADLHPQLMDVPFFGLVIALVVAYVTTVRAGLRGRSWFLAAALGVAIGLVRMVHTWDFPTAVLVGFGGIGIGQLLGNGPWQQRWWQGVGHAALAAAVLTIPFAPYAAHFETFDPGLLRAKQTTRAHQYFVHFGLFVTFAVAFLSVRYHEELRLRGRNHRGNLFLAAVNGWLELGALAVFVVGLAAFTWGFGLTTLALGFVFEAFLLNLLWLELRHEHRNAARFLVTTIFALAFAISVGVDVVTLKNDIDRMNTVFKFGLQAWQLFALASAFTAWYVGRALWRVRAWRMRPRRGRRFAAVGGTVALVLLLFGAGIFVVSGTSARQEARFASSSPTLDGLAFLPHATFRETFNPATPSDDVLIQLDDDRPLIDWLRTNVSGSPVIVEAVGPLYHWTGRISEYTGLPAVIGWDWHQIQQRTDYQGLVERRRLETTDFYATSSKQIAEQYLLRYNVAYVVVGTEERAHGTPAGLAKFGEMAALTEVYGSGDYAIYRVDPSKLPTAR